MGFVDNVLLFPTVKEFWKSVKNGESYQHEFGVLLFWDSAYKIFNLTIFDSCVLTLPCKLPHAKYVKCNAFSLVDCGWLWKKPVFVVGWRWKEPVVYSRCSKWCPFAFTHVRSHAVYWSTTLSMMLCGMLPMY